jgi:uncharacterized protein YkwD
MHTLLPSIFASFISFSSISTGFPLSEPSHQAGTKIEVQNAATVDDCSSYNSPSQFKDTVLTIHNRVRYQHNAKPLAWNHSLVESSNQWASKCIWRHSHSGTGENLSLRYPNATDAVEVWANERKIYDFASPNVRTHKVGHFTQMVWKDTRSIGCAAVGCAALQGWYTVCQYWPPGNWFDPYAKDEVHLFRKNVEAQVHYDLPPQSYLDQGRETAELAKSSRGLERRFFGTVWLPLWLASMSQSSAAVTLEINSWCALVAAVAASVVLAG